MAVRKLLGVDYGHVRIGLAVGDSDTKIAQPLRTIEKSSTPAEDVAAEAKTEGIDEIVLGLPRGLDGQETIQTAAARHFAGKLEALGLIVHLQDEAGTSELARERVGAAADKPAVDAEAAAIILQDYLGQL